MAKVKSKKTRSQRKATQQVQVPKQQRKMNAGTPKRRRLRRSKMLDPYVVCRLNPFASKGSQGIPDGTQIRKLVVDHRQTTTITFGSTGQVGIVFAPALPSCVWVRSADATTLINGVATAAGFANQFLATVPTTEWRSQPLTYFNLAGQYDNLPPLYNSGRARIVSGAWQIMYLGTSLTNSGAIRVNNGSLVVDPPLPNLNNFTVFNWSGAGSTVYATSQVFVRPVQTSLDEALFTNSGASYDTTITRLSNGCHGIMKHAGKEFEFKEVFPNVTYLSSANNENNSMLLNVSTTPLITANAGVCQFYDHEWDCSFISITGGTPGQSFMLDTILCVEYAPLPNSSVFALAKHGRPANPAAIKQAEAGASQMPVSSPGSFASTVTSAISTAATIAEVATAVGSIML